jgi:hypothetical protein
MSYLRLTAGTAFAVAFAASLAAQTPPQNPPTTAQPQSMNQKATVTLEGCLVQEKDVPGRQANPAEKAGVMEDFILTAVKYVKPPAGAPATDPAPTGTSGVGMLPMFEVRGLEKDKLTEHIGKRVQLEGTIDPADLREAQAAKAKGEPGNDLPEVQVSSIKSVPGDCKPAAK